MRAWLASITAAIAVQPFIFAARLAPDYLASSSQSINGVGFIVLSIIAVATTVVLTLGVPAFMLLRKYKRENWMSLALSGFLLCALPVSLLWPRRRPGFSSSYNWHGKLVEFYIGGEPTQYAWFNYVENIFFYGMHGLVGALVFYAVWRKLSPPS